MITLEKTMLELSPDADYTSMEDLANELISRITSYTLEQEKFDENDLDGFYDYLGGLISAYQSVAGMIGVPHEIAYPNGDC